jgi:hypothetical protein
MEESIFVDEGLHGVDGDEDEPLLPSISSPESVSAFTLLCLRFGILPLLRLILLAFLMHSLVLVIFSDLLLFVSLLTNSLLLHSPPPRLSI